MNEKNENMIEETKNDLPEGEVVCVNKKKKTSKKVLAIVLGVLFFLLSFAGGFLTNYLIRGKEANVAYDLVAIMQKVGYIYDPTTGENRKITDKDVGDALINGLLDDYAKYYTAEEYAEVTANSKGNYRGIGVSFYKGAGTEISQVVGNSPAYHEGLKAGDKLLSGSVGGETVIFNDEQDIVNFIGAYDLGTDLTFTYERKGVQDTVPVEKKSYVASYVTYYDNQNIYEFINENGGAPQGQEKPSSEMNYLDNEVAYIKLDSFEGGAAWQMGKALNYMKERDKTKLILDLRGNGGGYMDVLTDIASYFINNGGKKKSAVAIAVGKTGEQTFYTDNNRYKDISSIAVIGDKNTASASECLIGVLKTYVDGVKIVVEKDAEGVAKTFGKGIMQTTYTLITGGAFKLTTAKIVWPNLVRTCIHGVGVTSALDAIEAEKGAGVDVALDELKNVV